MKKTQKFGTVPGVAIELSPSMLGVTDVQEWVQVQDSAAVQVFRTVAGVVINPQKAGDYFFVATADGEASTAFVVVATAETATTTRWKFSNPLPAIRAWTPSLATAGKIAGGAVVALLLTLGAKGCDVSQLFPPPAPIIDPIPLPPAPPPIAQVAKVVAVIVEDTSKRTPAEGKVIMDPKVRAGLATEGHRVIEFSIADPSYKSRGYESYVVEVGGPPAVLVFDAAKIGQVSDPLANFRLPATAAEFDSSVRKAVKK